MIKNIILISDQHCGCTFGLCPPKVKLDEGFYEHTRLQSVVWAWWNEFWDDWVPLVTKGEPYIVINNGDAIDGVHHGTVSQISHNIQDQTNIAYEVLAPIVDKAAGYYHIRGTDAHVGKSGQDEERLAERLGAIKDEETGHFARWELWLRFRGGLCHFTHHIGTTNSMAYESTAVHKELVEAYNEAGRWNEEPPALVARGHRHRYYKCEVAGEHGDGIGIVAPGWQLKTPFVYKGTLGRAGMPHIGGILIRSGSEDMLYTRKFIKKVSRPKEVTI